jgi:mediator of RNA polymerase II transcription subunit 22
MADPQTDVSRPSALPTANLLPGYRSTAAYSLVDQNSTEYLDAIEEEWNKKVDLEVETLVDGMVDLVGLAAVRVMNALGRVIHAFRHLIDW